jgi:hypothetical protein
MIKLTEYDSNSGPREALRAAPCQPFACTLMIADTCPPSLNPLARLQALAATGSIAISEPVRKLVEGYFALKPLGPARIKRISEPVEVFEVTGLAPLHTRVQIAAQRGLPKFVGRQVEMEQMRRAFELAKAGHGQVVAAIGEPGVGKSRLFYEFKATASGGCTLLEAISVSHGKASAYLPLIELLRSALQRLMAARIRCLLLEN